MRLKNILQRKVSYEIQGADQKTSPERNRAASNKNKQANSLAIDSLADDPRPHGCKKLKGEKEYLWRIRVGEYRVIYMIDDEIKVIDVRKVGDRKNIYQ